jgi:hypothetical protein
MDALIRVFGFSFDGRSFKLAECLSQISHRLKWAFCNSGAKRFLTRLQRHGLECSLSAGALAILAPCARLISANPKYQSFFDVLEKYWTGWILIAAFFVMLVARLAYAPFLIYEEALSRIEDSEEKLRGLVSELENDRDTKKEKERLAQQIDIMSEFWSEGKRLLAKVSDTDIGVDAVRSEAQAWFDKVIAWLKGEWNRSSDANYFRDCDDGSDDIDNPIPRKYLEDRHALYRGVYQRVRNLHVIIDRVNASLPSFG